MKILDMKTVWGFIGAGLTVFMPFLEFLITIFQVIAGAGGLVLLFLSIRHKLIQIKNDSKKNKHKNQ